MVENEQNWIDERLQRWRLARDAQALGELLKWQRDRAYTLALRILKGSDAEDAVQQAFIKLLSRTHAFESPDAFRVAVYRAVMQRALDLARHRRSEQKLEAAMRQIPHAQPVCPHSALEHEETRQLLNAELDCLSEQDRATLVLCCQEGLSVYEAATVLEVPRETLRYRLSALLERLRTNLRKKGISLSLLLLVSEIGKSGTVTAPATLCAVLDGMLPGDPCAAIAPGQPAAVKPALIAEACSRSLSDAVLPLLASAVLLAALAIGAWRTQPLSSPPPEASSAKHAEQMREQTERPRQQTQVAPEEKAPAPAAADATELGLAPEKVREAASRAIKGIQLTQVRKEFDEGRLVYEFAGTAAGVAYEITLSAEGEVLEIEKADEEDEDQGNKLNEAKPTPALRTDF